MRMHRGSSKDGGRQRPPAETLPLSASPPPLRVELVWAQRGTRTSRVVHVPPGTTVRGVLRAVGEHPEGSAVFLDERSVPLDREIVEPVCLTVVRTFSGG